ncbi:hypothetical protein AMTRI_Chr06g172140 [Amborella trichopoda]
MDFDDEVERGVEELNLLFLNEPEPEKVVIQAINPSIWNNLPPDILERVIHHLPALSLLKFRTICRDWYRLISSRSFSHYCNDPWFAIFPTKPSNHFSAFNPDLNKWHKLSLSFLPCDCNGLSSSGGLICCKGVINNSLSIIVCNPISQNYVILPPLLRKRIVPIVNIINLGLGFRVIVAGDDVLADGHSVSDLTSEIYDSATGEWSMSGRLPPQSDLEFGSAFCRGILYVPTYRPIGTVRFDPQLGMWSRVPAFVPRNSRNSSLVECSGRLFMVGGVQRKQSIVGIRVWELCDCSVWREFARMRRQVLRKMKLRLGDLYFSAVGHGDFICLSIYESPVMIGFNIADKKWIWLPQFPWVGSFDGVHLLGHPYKPTLHTPVD